jgi:2-polyprenyl-3-methyl-5-hydroxy-6-metoxy-1,4-benzoquinol methylase
MLEELENCPVCKGKKEFKEYISAKDYLITKEEFKLVKCSNCNFIFTNPRPNSTSLGKYYKSSNYDSHKTSTTSLKDLLYKKVRDYSTRKKLEYINEITKGKTLLDIGCGAGYFINYCHANNWKVEGLEPNLEALPYIPPTIKIHSHLTTIKDNAFDIITMWHSLEHIEALDEVILKAKSALKSDGKLLIAIPNISSLDFKIYQEYWAALDVPRHLFHFTQETLAYLLKRFGLKIIGTKPMIFDSYYVSLLSEQYKTGKMNYFKALTNGLKSNNWAKRNNNNYSSLLYTVSKDESLN